jgi:hypothetical protein
MFEVWGIRIFFFEIKSDIPIRIPIAEAKFKEDV